MIANAVTLIKEELGAYLERVSDDITADRVILGNIANLDDPESTYLSDDRIVVTNVIIEEESSLKNKPHFQPSPTGGTDYVEPPVYLNLYVLFSATYAKTDQDGYEKALDRLSLVIQFFQAKRFFTITNSPFTSIATTDTLSDEVKTEIKLRVELYTLTFEQTNHLWGSLGGKQSPSVMYKIRLVKIQDRIPQDAPLIEEIYEHGKTVL